jgi:hypothetical protein
LPVGEFVAKKLFPALAQAPYSPASRVIFYLFPKLTSNIIFQTPDSGHKAVPDAIKIPTEADFQA